ncbi:MAG: DNRLRE domain-containing protein [Acidobacteria bacterium]|nr:DNRLRE domain-containing protein [Acidobacteriota bacterium]
MIFPVKWRTNSTTDSRVRYGTQQGNLNQSASAGAAVTNHEIAVSGLAADTKYYYSVGNAAAPLAGGDSGHFFVTSPVTGTAKPTRIWVLGDSGTADANAQAVRDAFANYTGVQNPELLLMLGDNAYNNGTDAEYQSAVFDMYPQFLRNTILWPTLGNHDGQSADSNGQSGPYYDIFSLPKSAEAGGVATGTEAYYSFDYGNIHFVCLESFETDRSTGGAMLSWLVTDLEANTQPWLIAFWHHPPYSKGSHDSDTDGLMTDMRQNALPILEQHGVDLVLTGHSHSYERSFLIDGHYGASGTFNPAMKLDGGDGNELGNGAYSKTFAADIAHEGAVYAVAGASGKISGGPLNHPAMVVSINALGSVVIDVDGGRLDIVTESFQEGVSPDPSYDGTSDTYISQNAPTSNFGLSGTLLLDGDDPSGSTNDLASLILWDLSSIPPGATVDSAEIDIEVFNISSGAYNIYELKRDWFETGATWNVYSPGNAWGTPGASGAGDRGSLVLGTVTAGSLGSYKVILNADGIAAVQGWVDNPSSNHGIIVANPSTTDGVDFRSSDYGTATQRPRLTVSYSSFVDSEAPDTPAGLAIVSKTDTEVDLQWSPSADNVGVDHYRVLRNAVEVGTTSAVTFTDTGLDPDTAYNYTVTALDAAGNESVASSPLVVTTDAAPDTEDPTAPGTPVEVSTTETEASISWAASTDNVGVTAYDVYRNGGLAGSTGGATTTFADSGLAAATSYGYHVIARDAAGNESAPSGVLNVTTDSATVPKLHISSISIERRSAGTNRYARAVISVVDDAGAPTNGANVTAQWSGLTSDTDSGLTTGGSVQFDSNRVNRSASGQFIVTVTGVSGAGFEYDPDANVQTAACVDINGTVCFVGPPDTDPPAAPGPLSATPGPGSASLNWPDNSTDPDWAEFLVYRSAVPGSGYSLIVSGLSASQFNDTGLAAGVQVYYVVTSRDTSGNESASSNEASATPQVVVGQNMHVSGINLTVSKQGKNYRATATVTVQDQNGAPLGGVQVTGSWELRNAAIGNASGTTSGSGTVAIDSAKRSASAGDVFRFTVTNLSLAGYTYDSGSNTETSDTVPVP